MPEEITSAALTTYQFFTVNELDGVISVQEIECSDDGRAMEIAGSLVTGGRGVEVWEVCRRVC